MIIAHTASGEVYYARLDDLVSEENAKGAIDVEGGKLHMLRMPPVLSAPGAKAEGGKVNGADETVDVTSAGAGNLIERFRALADELTGLGEYYDGMIAEGLATYRLKEEILNSPMFALAAESAERLAATGGEFSAKMDFLELVHGFLEYWHQPACTWTDFRWDHRRQWHLEFMNSKILTVPLHEFDDEVTRSMLSMVDALLACKPGSSVAAFRTQLGCVLVEGAASRAVVVDVT